MAQVAEPAKKIKEVAPLQLTTSSSDFVAKIKSLLAYRNWRNRIYNDVKSFRVNASSWTVRTGASKSRSKNLRRDSKSLTSTRKSSIRGQRRNLKQSRKPQKTIQRRSTSWRGLLRIRKRLWTTSWKRTTHWRQTRTKSSRTRIRAKPKSKPSWSCASVN